MTASDLFKAGKLADAIDAQTQEVRSHPADAGRRTFLFELLLFAGDLDRAAKQLDAVRADTPELVAAAEGYRGAIEAERQRRGLSAGTDPVFFGEPPPHAAFRLAAAHAFAAGDAAAAAELLRKADEAAPRLTGTLNGKPFDGLRDADDLFASVLEVFAKGRYVWVPLEEVENLALNPPRFPRDLLYAPARLTLRDGSTGEVFLPALYPQSYAHADEAVRLGRDTAWDGPDGAVRGAGGRVFLFGDEPAGLPDWRELAVTPPA